MSFRSFLASSARRYHQSLYRYPLATQMVTGGALWCVGDLISQSLSSGGASKERLDRLSSLASLESLESDRIGKDRNDRKLESWHSSIDWQRVGRMTIYGCFCASPIYVVWYSGLERFVNRLFAKSVLTALTPTMKSRRKWQIIGTKLLLDTALFDPAYLTFFFTCTNLMEGQSFQHAMTQLKHEFVETYIVDVLVWLPVQTLNFRFVPVVYQPLVVNSGNIFWNAYLSYVKHREHA